MKTHFRLLSALILAALSLLPKSESVIEASSSVDWTRRIPPDVPPELLGHEMAYDTVRNVMVMYGAPNSNNIYELSGNTWTNRMPVHSPPGDLYRYGMAYDEANRQVVIFGGRFTYGNTSDQTWVWDGTDWTLKTPATIPPARTGAATAYDRNRGVVVMYGGDGFDDTWEWNGINWTEGYPLHTPGSVNTSSNRIKLVFDTARSIFVLFRAGVTGVSETWEYDGNDWVKREPTTSPSFPIYHDHEMTYDETIHRTILMTEIGGTMNHIWEWDGTTWTDRTPVTGLSRSARSNTSFVYDNAKGKVVLYGGYGEGAGGPRVFKDTWEWDSITGTWSQSITPTNPYVSNAGLVYDSARGQVVRFGGLTHPGAGILYFHETWVLGDNDSHWTQKFPAHQPPNITVDSLAYDSRRSRVVLFGGGFPDQQMSDETWEWDGTDWTQIHTAVSPPKDGGGPMAYDSDRGVIVMLNSTGNTWEYDGANWVQRFPQHSPSPRCGSGMVYDSRRHKTVLFGAYCISTNETWEWDGTDWTLRTLPNSPEPRAPAMAYDASRGVTVVFGGTGFRLYNDTWEYDGNTWTKIQTAISPSAREATYATYSTNRQAVIVFGGTPDYTWEYRSTLLLRITTESPLPSGIVGQPYSVVLTAAGGTLPYTWSIASGSLPPGLNLDATTGTISGVPTTAGTFGFTIRVTDSSSVSVTKPFGLAPPAPSGNDGSDYTLPINIDPAPGSGGSDPGTCSSYSVVAGTLPDGLTLNPTTGVVSGTPTNGGTYNFTIGCTVSGGQNSGQTATKDFTITIYNPVPTIVSLNPSWATAGSPAFVLIVNGTNFVTASTVQWNGANRTTTYVSATQLRADISASDIASAGTANVTVVNPPPNGGTSNSVTFTIRSANQPPTVQAGGPYQVAEGGSVTVAATGSDPENNSLTYAWDLHNNGSFETNSQSATFSATGLDGPTNRTIAVQVTDSGGLKATAQATVNVLKVAPTANFVNTSGTVNEGQSATLAFSNPFDPSEADTTAGFRYSFDCTNDGAFEVIDSSAPSYACTYPDNGNFTAKGRIKDKDGGFTDYTAGVTVLNVAPTVGPITAPTDPICGEHNDQHQRRFQ